MRRSRISRRALLAGGLFALVFPFVAPGASPAVEPLFDGRSLAGWVPSGFEGERGVRVERDFEPGQAAIVIESGTTLGGITSTLGVRLPRMNYEVAFEAMRVAGGDFFGALTFPVENTACTLVLGGWGGAVVGISSIDGVDASGNETTREKEFADRRWYRVRVRVTPGRIAAWIDETNVVDLATEGRRLSLRPGDIQKARPLGISTYMTKAAVRAITLTRW
ncbi:MAG: family 16 glycoside hydrolase [Opitutaceae bacterium]